MSEVLASDLQANQQWLEEVLKDCADVTIRPLGAGGHPAGLLLYVQGMVDEAQVSTAVLTPLLQASRESGPVDLPIGQVKRTNVKQSLLEELFSGAVILVADGSQEAMVLMLPGGKRRAVSEPKIEPVVRGPREAFTEDLHTNINLVRVRLKSPNLKMVRFTIGTRTSTAVMLAYLDGVARQDVIEHVRDQLTKIEMDGVLESGYIEEMLAAQPYSPFPEMHYSERPDVVTAQLLGGRFAIFVEGTPIVLTAPVNFFEMMQAPEDYYEAFLFATFIRWVRYGLLAVALYMPSIYIAVTTFHPDMIPTNLVLSIATAREAIPFPALVEALIMELSFEALREASTRLPRTVGQAVGILGALVIGQATVQAGIVSAPTVIVVSLTGIASFAIPRFNAAIAIRMLRFPMMFLASAFGLFGIILGTFWLILHVVQLRSFGMPYLTGLAPMNRDMLQEIIWRAPWWAQRKRMPALAPKNTQRMAEDLSPPEPRAGR